MRVMSGLLDGTAGQAGATTRTTSTEDTGRGTARIDNYTAHITHESSTRAPVMYGRTFVGSSEPIPSQTKGKTMARTARTETGMARAEFFARLDIAAAQGAAAKTIQNMILDEANEFAVACSTRDAFGGRRIGVILDAMIEAQNGKCFFCTETFWSIGDSNSPEENGSIPNVFLLIPSQLWADVEITGYSAHESAYVPGNMVAACILCTNDRDRATEAAKSPVCVTIDSLHPNQIAKILLRFPKGVKKSSLDHESARVAQRRLIRSNQVGF